MITRNKDASCLVKVASLIDTSIHFMHSTLVFLVLIPTHTRNTPGHTMAAAKSQASSQPTKQAAQPPIDDVAAADDDQSDSDSLEEGEYEIDEILSHQELPPPTGKGKQAAGPLEFEYFVSWVGYGPEFNEWVAEENL